MEQSKIISFVTTKKFLFFFALSVALISTIYSFIHATIISYGDAESHLNIAKRVVTSITPGFSQLGGIWLPIPHLLMVPLVYFNPLWRTGLAGSIISGISYIVSCFVVYKLILNEWGNKIAALLGFFVFALNPNVLYMQTTPLTELPLICFFLLSVYYFTIFLEDTSQDIFLIFAAFFGFCASLSRYDGWALVFIEFIVLIFYFIIQKEKRTEWMGKITLFSTLSFFGILIWIMWDWIILGNPLYFSNSPFSAQSQQQGWLAKGELPAYHNLLSSIAYYFVVSANNIGILLTGLICIGLVIFSFKTHSVKRFFTVLLLLSPFIFYVTTLYTGQSVIFTPELTPSSFEWRTFNVRYGIMMVPLAAFLTGFMASRKNLLTKCILFTILIWQLTIFLTGKESIVTLIDGTEGLSRQKSPDAQIWLKKHYDHGYILIDDYARTVSIINSGIPMENVIYIGNKPYWSESLVTPEKYASWIVMQKDDTVWTSIYNNPVRKAELYKYFQKEYTSPNILIFKSFKAVAMNSRN